MPVRVWGERCVGVVGELVKSQREAHIQVKSTLHSEEPELGLSPAYPNHLKVLTKIQGNVVDLAPPGML